MPGMDGFTVAERVKAIGYGDLSVTMLTSDDLRAEIPKAARYGLDAHLIKPVRMRRIVRGDCSCDGAREKARLASRESRGVTAV
jgi:DNA-binding NarL/FixJ family response regulator